VLQIQVSVTITYFLIPEYLKLLHDEYDVNYESIIESSAQAAIKVSTVCNLSKVNTVCNLVR